MTIKLYGSEEIAKMLLERRIRLVKLDGLIIVKDGVTGRIVAALAFFAQIGHDAISIFKQSSVPLFALVYSVCVIHPQHGFLVVFDCDEALHQ